MKLKVGDIPVFVHWSVLVSVGVVCLVAGFAPLPVLSLFFSYLLLIALHETAHALAARRFGLKVLSIDISGIGGKCRFQFPASYGAAFLIASAGLLMQLLLLIVTMIALRFAGRPSSSSELYLVTGFFYVNAALLIVNVIPIKERRDRFGTDGYLLWVLARNKYRGRPYSWPDTSATFEPKTRLTDLKGFTPVGFQTGIEILNDNFTPMEFVVNALTTHLHLSQTEAIRLMLDIHAKGGVIVPLPSAEEARTVAQTIASEAVACGHPLICRAIETHGEQA